MCLTPQVGSSGDDQAGGTAGVKARISSRAPWDWLAALASWEAEVGDCSTIDWETEPEPVSKPKDDMSEEGVVTGACYLTSRMAEAGG